MREAPVSKNSNTYMPLTHPDVSGVSGTFHGCNCHLKIRQNTRKQSIKTGGKVNTQAAAI